MIQNLPNYITTQLRLVCDYCQADNTFIEAGKKPNGEPMIVLTCADCRSVAEYALSELEQQKPLFKTHQFPRPPSLLQRVLPFNHVFF